MNRKEPYAIVLLGRILAGDESAKVEAARYLKQASAQCSGRPLSKFSEDDLVLIAHLAFKGHSTRDIHTMTSLPIISITKHLAPSKAMLRACEKAGLAYYVGSR